MKLRHLLLFFFISVFAQAQTVVDIIVDSDDHNTLEAAILAAELDEALSGVGLFTVFAPTDDAFAALPAGTVEALLEDPSGALSDILLYHVVGTQLNSTDLADGQSIIALNDDAFTVTINDDGVFINNAQVTIVDIPASNGVVHVLNAVLLPPTNTVVDIVVNSDDHNTLEAAVIAANLAGTLSGDGPFTLFAPTDDAFAALPAGTVDALLADPSGALTDILLYHAVSGTALSTDLSDGQVIATINGKDITVTINTDGVFINDAQVTVADLVADNGVVHVIDAVLLPPTNTVVDIVVNSPDHTTLEAAVIAADLAGTLSGDGPFTLFAPTDDAFAALPAGTVDALLADPSGALTDILLYHAVSGTALSTDLSDGQVIATINGKDITVTVNADGVFINDAQVTVADLVADNGVVHVIDAVLLPPTNTVVDIVVNSPDHNTLEAAVIAADLAGTLSGDGPFTLFAPTDDAFAALPAGTVDALLADPSGALTDILLYHAVSGTALSTDLSDGQVIATINGKDITVTVNADGVFINDAQVTVADLVADNGVVHVIDAVLLPPTNTVVDIVVNSPDHNTLEAAVIAADLAGTLSGDGPFTLFAPTDDAFAALPAGTVDALLADPSGALTDILLYHAVSGTALSTDLSDGQVIATINGKDITVTINTDGVFINDAQVTVADLVADNGVVHVIDAVLLPVSNTVVDIVVNSPDHTTLEAAVIAADLAGTLSGDGPFTLFAPTDDAFAALPAGTVDALLADPSGALTDILLYHAVSGTALSTDLSDGQVIATINGRNITVTINADGVFINDAQVTIADLVADNGVVHVIDAVLLPPPPTVFDIIRESPVHNTLETLVVAAELDAPLSADGTFTVFAPTDEAFGVLNQETIDALLADPTGQLADILSYHVTGSVIGSGDLSDRLIGTSINGFDYLITLPSTGAMVNNAMITITDLEGSNGLVHVIDAILLPNTTASVIFNSQGFEVLTNALVATGLINNLNDLETTTTLFAPTDAAFSVIPEDIFATLEEPTLEKLTNVLLYHVTAERTFADELSDGQMLTTLLGETSEVTINNDGVFINNVQITQTDFFTGNGIIHVIDAVLLPAPSTVMDVIIQSEVHETLQAAIEAAELAETLQGEGTFTVFAPTDEAFGLLPPGTVETLLEDPTGQLADILLYHVLGSEVLSTDLSDGTTAETLFGDNVTVSIVDGTVLINNAEVIIADIQTDNGVVHVIDMVLLPPVSTTELPSTSANVYPNPTNSNVTIEFDEAAFSNPQMTLVNSTGQIVKRVPTFTSNTALSLNDIENGVYSIIISDGINTITKRVTKIQ